MSSSVYYKFKSGGGRNWDTVSFDAAVISVLDLKRAIVKHKHLDKSLDDFDLRIENAQTGEQYKDDSFLIPKNTSVIVRKIVANRQRSLTIKAEPQIAVSDQPANKTGPTGPADTTGMGDDDRRMLDLVNQSAAQAPAPGPFRLQRGYGRGGIAAGGQRMFRNPNGVPPAGYVCKRCGIEGHYIQNCPTNGNPAFDIKKAMPATGIPRAFLQAVDKVEDTRGTGRAALIVGSTYAVARPNDDVFNNVIASQKSYGTSGMNMSYTNLNAAPSIPLEYICSLCKKILRNPMVTPCCFTSFCDECIRQALVADGSYTCPRCGETGINPDDLRPNKKLQELINEFESKMADSSTKFPLSSESTSNELGMDAVNSEIELTLSTNGQEESKPSKEELNTEANTDLKNGETALLNEEEIPNCGRCGLQGHLSKDCPTHLPPPGPPFVSSAPYRGGPRGPRRNFAPPMNVMYDYSYYHMNSAGYGNMQPHQDYAAWSADSSAFDAKPQHEDTSQQRTENNRRRDEITSREQRDNFSNQRSPPRRRSRSMERRRSPEQRQNSERRHVPQRDDRSSLSYKRSGSRYSPHRPRSTERRRTPERRRSPDRRKSRERRRSPERDSRGDARHRRSPPNAESQRTDKATSRKREFDDDYSRSRDSKRRRDFEDSNSKEVQSSNRKISDSRAQFDSNRIEETRTSETPSSLQTSTPNRDIDSRDSYDRDRGQKQLFTKKRNF